MSSAGCIDAAHQTFQTRLCVPHQPYTRHQQQPARHNGGGTSSPVKDSGVCDCLCPETQFELQAVHLASSSCICNANLTLPLQAQGSKVDRAAEFGPFKKKCLILAILETDGQTQATAALGRVVIDLSEFASVDGQETRTFHVACNKAIHAAVGDPQLMITVRYRDGMSWKARLAQSTSLNMFTSNMFHTLNRLCWLQKGHIGEGYAQMYIAD